MQVFIDRRILLQIDPCRPDRSWPFSARIVLTRFGQQSPDPRVPPRPDPRVPRCAYPRVPPCAHPRVPPPCPTLCSPLCPTLCSPSCPTLCSPLCPTLCSPSCPTLCSPLWPTLCWPLCPTPSWPLCPTLCSPSCPTPCSPLCPTLCSPSCPAPSWLSCPAPCWPSCPAPHWSAYPALSWPSCPVPSWPSSSWPSSHGFNLSVSVCGSPEIHWFHSTWTELNPANVSRTCTLFHKCLPDPYLLFRSAMLMYLWNDLNHLNQRAKVRCITVVIFEVFTRQYLPQPSFHRNDERNNRSPQIYSKSSAVDLDYGNACRIRRINVFQFQSFVFVEF